MNFNAFNTWRLLPQNRNSPSNYPGTSTLPCGFDLRKARSRDAARFRRGRENFEFLELARLLPLHEEIAGQLDKASVVRLAVSYLKLRQFCEHGEPTWLSHRRHNALLDPKSDMVEFNARDLDTSNHILQSLDGFILALSRNLTILYVSETVSIFLGLSQVDMMGCDFLAYVHPADRQTVTTCVDRMRVTGKFLHPGRHMEPPAYCIRMKSNLSKRNITQPSSGYRVVQIHLRPRFHSLGSDKEPHLLGLTGVAIALPPLCLSEMALPCHSAVLRLSRDFGIRSVEQNQALSRLGATIDCSLYQYAHPCDVERLQRCHMEVLHRDQSLSPCIRWLRGSNCSETWVQLCFSQVYEKRGHASNLILAIIQLLE